MTSQASRDSVSRSVFVETNRDLDIAIAAHNGAGLVVQEEAPARRAVPLSAHNGILAQTASVSNEATLRETIDALQREVARLSAASSIGLITAGSPHLSYSSGVTTGVSSSPNRPVVENVQQSPAPVAARTDFSLHDFDIPIVSNESVDNLAASINGQGFSNLLAEKRNVVEALQSQIAAQTVQLSSAALEEESARLMTTPEGRIHTLRTAIDEVRGMPGVTDVRVRRGTLHGGSVIAISLDTLYAKIENDVSRNMGNIVIEIEAVKFISRNIEAATNQWVLILNKTHFHKVNGMRPPAGLEGHAGHVGRDGRACLGGWSTPIKIALRDFDLRSVVVHIIGLIENPNKNDGMGCYALQYPTVVAVATTANAQVNNGPQEEAQDSPFDGDDDYEEHHNDDREEN